YEVIFYSPDPHIVERVRRYDPEIYRSLGKEKYIQMVSQGSLSFSTTPPDTADILVLCGDALKNELTSPRDMENLVRRVSDATSISHGIIFSVLAKPGTTSNLARLHKRNAKGSLPDTAYSYIGLVHRVSIPHPYYSEDEKIEKIVSSIAEGPHIRTDCVERAEASVIALLAVEAAQAAVLHHTSAILDVPLQLPKTSIGVENESVLKFLSRLETRRGRLIGHLRRFHNKIFENSCRDASRRARELASSKSGAVNVLCVAGDDALAKFVSDFLSARRCRVHSKDPLAVYDMVERRGGLDQDYDLVVVDGTLSRTAQILEGVVGGDRVYILSGVRPPYRGA
ncbi:MAG: hypothetical protein QW815_02035, partial [Nitrososphaerota archaeon]